MVVVGAFHGDDEHERHLEDRAEVPLGLVGDDLEVALAGPEQGLATNDEVLRRGVERVQELRERIAVLDHLEPDDLDRLDDLTLGGDLGREPRLLERVAYGGLLVRRVPDARRGGGAGEPSRWCRGHGRRDRPCALGGPFGHEPHDERRGEGRGDDGEALPYAR